MAVGIYKKYFVLILVSFFVGFPAFALDVVTNPDLTRLCSGSGTNTNTTATNVATCALSGLTASDTLFVTGDIYCSTQAIAETSLYSSTDSLALSRFWVQNGVAANTGSFGYAYLNQQANNNLEVFALETHSTSKARNSGVTSTLVSSQSSITTTTAWTGSWTLALRQGAVTSGGSCDWQWKVYKLGNISTSTLTSADVGLGNVENTALSTWVGSTNLATLGTVTTGTWSADVLDVSVGGTGQVSFEDGELLIGNSTGNGLDIGVLTEGTGITVTNGAGSITIDSSGGSSLPADDVGWLENDGVGNLSWSAPTGSLPVASVGFLNNDGADNLSWQDMSQSITCTSGSGSTWTPCQPFTGLDVLFVLGWLFSFVIFLGVAFWRTNKV